MIEQAAENTDRELYREPKRDLPSDYYAPSVHVTEDGRIGMNVGGTVITLPIREWVARARATHHVDPPTEPGHVEFEIEVVPHDWANDGMGWHRGRDTPARVAQVLRDYAEQVEHFTPPNPPRRTLVDKEMAQAMAKKYGPRLRMCVGCGKPLDEHPAGPPCAPPPPPGRPHG